MEGGKKSHSEKKREIEENEGIIIFIKGVEPDVVLSNMK